VQRGPVIFGKVNLANVAAPALGAEFGSARWFVAATQPAKEWLALTQLERQGFRSFCPRFRKPWRHARRTGVRLAPLFPGYVFVSFDPGEAPWRSINGTLGVRRLLGSALQPQAVPAGFMAQLQARCPGGVLDTLVDELAPGRRVRILTGPFADRVAVIERLAAGDRVRLLLEVMGGAARLELAPNQLAPE